MANSGATCGKKECEQVLPLPSFTSLRSWKTHDLKTTLSWLSKPYFLYSKEKVNSCSSPLPSFLFKVSLARKPYLPWPEGSDVIPLEGLPKVQAPSPSLLQPPLASVPKGHGTSGDGSDCLLNNIDVVKDE